MGYNESEIPILEKATLEQALRWLHYGHPPREARFENLLKYPRVLNTDAPDFLFHFAPRDELERFP